MPPVNLLLAAVSSAMLASCAAITRPDDLITTDHRVPHVSTVPANAGQQVNIFVREKTASAVLAGKPDLRERIVLFVHGGTVPAVPDYDFDYKDYSWMGFLAREGFKTYAMDLSGYGGSPRPLMDDPCNLDPQELAILSASNINRNCPPKPLTQFNTINSDWDEIDTVVDYIRRTNDVPRIHIIGWSAGGPRVGGYVAQHPDKVERVMLYAPSPTIAGPIPDKPGPGYPMTLQTREDFEKKRWDPDVRCPGQVEAGLRDVLWKAIMQWDYLGREWHPPEGVMRGRTATRFGWTSDLAARVTAPTLVIVGEYDRLAQRKTVYDQLGSRDKVFVNVSCASHFMLWEMQHRALHEASLEWLGNGRLKGMRRGEMRVEPDGRFVSAKEAAK
jgi:pimeloyl-ACP methyl ester carboxylesterase